jgi:hypothetical protein
VKFAWHLYYIASAMNKPGSDGIWDEEDGFYYDLLRLADGSVTLLKVRSMVGLLPRCATTIVEASARERIPGVMAMRIGVAAIRNLIAMGIIMDIVFQLILYHSLYSGATVFASHTRYPERLRHA